MNACTGTPLSLLEYLIERGWKPARDSGREEVAGLCPLHRETRPSFYVNRRKQVFYCHACGRGGGIGQLRRWLEGSAWNHAGSRTDSAGLLEATYTFYQQQLARSADALVYLRQRGICQAWVLEQMRIGYAPGACLRGHLFRLGYRGSVLFAAGLIDGRRRDRFFRCLTFPLEHADSLYGRAIDDGLWRHRFLPRPKGGLYGWTQAQAFSSLIVVEGLFDLAALWQAGFPQTVAALGSHLNPVQWAQLSGSPSRTVYVCFDSDGNDSGPSAARRLCGRLRRAGVEALRVALPASSDPAALFAGGASAPDFQRWLERARP
jgi:DNA primase